VLNKTLEYISDVKRDKFKYKKILLSNNTI